MLSKFEVRSSRVKGLSFHKHRPWILCGLHNGVVQIWDYRMNTPVDTYTEHAGSVRGVDFHVSQPLFVSGADDYTIKVWNYKLRRCLFTLTGHMDYIRTTFFHHEQPWIISSSDDYTVRIWNWQSRSCIACLPGHNHYVMCAKFHPTDLDLVVSASLDKTVRVWDISTLQHQKQEAGLAQDLLGTTDAVVKYQLEGHEKGVNWAEFHPTNPFCIVSAADDRTVRVWEISNYGAGIPRVTNVLRGHSNNVCCATFFQNCIISNSEDRSIRVWIYGGYNYEQLHVFRRDTDRFWILATHPGSNLIAAGHDNGLQVFKISRERPPFALTGDNSIQVFHKEAMLQYTLDPVSTGEAVVCRTGFTPPISMSVNPGNESQAVLSWPEKFEIVQRGATKRCVGTDAVFFGANKFAYRQGSDIFVKNCQDNNSKDKKLDMEFKCVRLFPGPMGCIVCKSEDHVYLYQVAQHGSISEASLGEAKYCVWSKDFQKVAFIAKNTITVMTKRFRLITVVSETSARMKSASFDETRDVLYFTTSNHLKYCNLRSGEVSTISTLKNVMYLVKAVGDRIWVLSREGKLLSKVLDNMELNFKLKLEQKAYRDVIRIMQRNELKGQALVGYLHKHGHSEIALHFVTDPLTRFNLALECGAMSVAKASATELNQPPIWRRLADTATKYGDVQLAQFAAAKAVNAHAAGMLSLITGNLATLGHIIDSSSDDNFKLQYGLYTGDVQQRVHILLNAGQLPLAYMTAKSHGLDDICEAILDKMDEDVAQRMLSVQCFPATEEERPAAAPENWPMLQVEDSMFTRLLKEPGCLDAIADSGLDNVDIGAAWGDEDDADDDFEAGAKEEDDGDMDEGEEGGGWDDDLDIDDVSEPLDTNAGGSGDALVVPQQYPPINQHWSDVYNIPAFHVAAGSYASALELLRRQIGLADPMPLKSHMMLLWSSVNASRPTWSAPSTLFPLSGHPPAAEFNGRHAPILPDYLPALIGKMQDGFNLFVAGKFAEAHSVFESILLQSVLTTVKAEADMEKIRALVNEASEYTRALSLQLYLRKPEVSPTESLECSLYLTHFKLRDTHQILVLSQAMTKAFKLQNMKTVTAICHRLQGKGDVPAKTQQQMKKMLSVADSNPSNAVEVNYDERNPFVLCSISHKPMYRGTINAIRCSYCRSPASPEFKGEVCPICTIATIGFDSAGLARQA